MQFKYCSFELVLVETDKDVKVVDVVEKME